ncbi:MAG: MlaC/ttg2D family ABC transporter substrate-binding protein [Thalassotalea sp.]
MKRIINLFYIALFTVSCAVSANTQSPYTTLELAGSNLFNRIANNQQELAKFPSLMETIVEEELMPYVDYQYSAYRILGTNLKKTTKAQRDQFTESMRQYLVRTYANALKKYNNQQVRFEADKPVADRRIVSVNTLIVEDGRPNIEITFQMRQHKTSKQWKAYDMIVEGISLLDTKKAEISSRIAKIGVEQVSLELTYLQK